MNKYVPGIGVQISSGWFKLRCEPDLTVNSRLFLKKKMCAYWFRTQLARCCSKWRSYYSPTGPLRGLQTVVPQTLST